MLLFLGLSTKGWSQSHAELQADMVKLGTEMYNNQNELERLNANYAFIKKLVTALKEPSSYELAFDSLTMISILPAPDERFKIFSWHIQLNDGTYRYYGAIQMNTSDGTLKLFPLLDHSVLIADANTAVLAPDNWLGAQYYQIIPVENGRKPYYVLLGWKGYTAKTTKKVIEVLYFEGSQLFMGLPVFEDGSKRKIYEYTKQASMLLRYDPDEQRIILDHLAPAEDRFKGQYEYYGPDMSYDAWQLKDGHWRLTQGIEVQNTR